MNLPLILIFDTILGFVASFASRWTTLRFIAWLLIPVFVAVLSIGPENFSFATGEQEMVWYVFAHLVLIGSGAAGIGTLLGYFARRVRKTKA